MQGLRRIKALAIMTICVLLQFGQANGAAASKSSSATLAPPTVSAASPNRGPLAGGTTVNLTGTSFTGATAVTFGGTAATSIFVNSATSITATTPARAAAGAVNIVVTTPGGSGTGTNLYTYVAAPTFTSITANSGPLAGGNTVTITGTNFTAATSVTFDGVAATSYTVISATSISAVAPANADPGAVDVVVTTAGGSATGVNSYTYAEAPTFSTISPISGPITAGTALTITGTNFAGTTTVRLGGTAATAVTVVNSTTITATAPAHAAGLVDVVITNPGGSVTGTGAYTYMAAPTFTNVSPNRGPIAGGTTVTITGTNFTSASAVSFGGTAATSFTVNSPSSISAIIPAHAVGAVNIVVTTPGGTVTANNAFTYALPPTFSSVSANRGPLGGGNTVTITGTNLTAATAVTFDGVAATSYTVTNSTTISAVVPANPTPGAVDVSVTTAAGTATGTDVYTYAAAPTFVSISPVDGPITSGTAITITGTNFAGTTTVTLGGAAATAVTVVNSTTITATAPAHAAGVVDVIVTNPGGSATGTGAYTYVPAPTYTNITPNRGPIAGGTSVAIVGTNFTGASAVTFGGTAATSFTVNGPTSITATTPPRAAGAVSLVITTRGGSVTGTNAYTYAAPPTFSSVTANRGPLAGGNTVTIAGTNLTAATAVTFGGVAATSYTVNSASSISAVVPANAMAGAVNVVVTTAGGVATGTNAYTYAAAPTFSGMTPTAGPIAGGTTVTITGTNFGGTTTVTLGGTAATSVTVVNANTITARTPAHTAGLVDVVITNPGGTVTGANAYTYSPVPTFSSITPNRGPLTGGTVVTINGANFTGATAVTFGGTAATSFTVDSPTSITATTPLRTAGAVNVAIVTPGGTATGTGAYTYAAPPTFSSISPNNGPFSGGTVTTITGNNFTAATSVTFGGVAAASYTVNSVTSITATTPANTLGAANVVITTPSGSVTGTNSFTYLKGNQTISFTTTAPTDAMVAGATYTPVATASSGLVVALTIDPSSTAVCSINSGVVSFLAAGTCRINANQAGNANYNAAPQVIQSFTVSRGMQTISFTSSEPTDAVVAGATYTPTATATSGLLVSFSIDAASSSVCELNSGVVSFIGSGTCIVNADQPGNSNYQAAPQVAQSFNVVPSEQTINFTSTAPANASVQGSTYTPTANATSGLAVSFTIDASSSGICTLSGGVVSFTSIGTCTINANQAGDVNYNAAPQVVQSFTVAPGNQVINFTSPAPGNAVVAGATYTPAATATSGLAVSLSIDASSYGVCDLNAGIVSFTGSGTCTINANQAGDANYNAASQVVQSFSVGAGNQTISFTSTAPSNAVVAGAGYTPTATATSGLVVSLSIDAASSNVCILNSGVVSFIGSGNCIINANQAGNTDYNAAPQVVQNFSVGAGSQTISFTTTAPSAAVVGGATYTPAATATSGLAVSLSIDASSNNVCVLTAGTVSFTGSGTCTINANQPGDANYNAAPQVVQSFSVGVGSQTISFTSTAPSNAVVAGAVYTPTATATSGLPVSLSIDAVSSGVCTLNSGVVSFVGSGNCIINANQAGDANYNAAPQMVQNFSVGAGSQTINFTSTAPSNAVVAGVGYIPTATATSGLPVSFSIDAASSNVCTLNSGVVSFIGSGNCIINADQTGNANYNPAPQMVQSFSVGAANQTITFTSTAPSTAVVAGATYTPTAIASSGLAVTLSIDASSSGICDLSGGVVSFISVGTCIINANQAGNGNYNPAPQVIQSVNVGAGSQSITITSVAPSNAVVDGGTYTPVATASSGLAVSFTIAPGSNNTCTINGGTVSFIGSGTCTINANQAGNANYDPAPQVIQSFNVGAGSQTINLTSTAPGNAVVGGSTYTPAATASSGLTVSFTIAPVSNNTCTINGGVVSFIGSGTCMINANQAGNANYDPAPQVIQSFSVGAGDQTISFTSTAPTAAVVNGITYSPTAVATSGLAVALTIDPSSTAVCAINFGVVSFTGAGTCIINANQPGNANYNPAPQMFQSFTVSLQGNQPQTISFTSPSPSPAIVGGATYIPTAVATSGLSVTLTIDASSSSVCAINAGTVSFIGAGTCTINANQPGDATYDIAPQVTQSFAVENQSNQTISFTSAIPASPIIGGTYKPVAISTSNLTVLLTVDAGSVSVCKINADVVSFIGEGVCTINANQPGDAQYLPAAQVQQVIKVNRILTPPDPTADKAITGLLKAQNISLQMFAQTNITQITDHLQHLHNFDLKGNKVNIGLRTDLLQQYQQFLSTSRTAMANYQQNPKQSSLPWNGTSNSNSNIVNMANPNGFSPPSLDSLQLNHLGVNDLLFDNLNISLWGTGNTSYGKINASGVERDHFTIQSLTAGLDFQAREKLIAGVAVSYASDRSTIENLNAESRGRQISLSGYSTYEIISNWFIDGMLGYGSPSFSGNRQSAEDGTMYLSDRDGKMTYGSLGLTNQFTVKSFMTQLFSRADLTAAKLNQYGEKGGAMALSYNPLNSSNTAWTTGIFISRTIAWSSWLATPSIRTQYSYNSGSNNMQNMFYTNLGPSQFSYNFNVGNLPKSVRSLALWLDFTKNTGSNVSLGWMGSSGSDGFIMNSFQLRVAHQLE